MLRRMGVVADAALLLPLVLPDGIAGADAPLLAAMGA